MKKRQTYEGDPLRYKLPVRSFSSLLMTISITDPLCMGAGKLLCIWISDKAVMHILKLNSQCHLKSPIMVLHNDSWHSVQGYR